MSMAEIARTSLANEPLALGALDGRYRSAVAPLVDYLSEAALNRDRVHVEVEWLIHLAENSVLPGTSPFTDQQQAALRKIVTDFDADSVKELAEIEAVTVHDVKAVEYYIANRLDAIGIGQLKPMVHFGCTSEDINNLSYALGVQGGVTQVWLPAARALVTQLTAMAEESREVPMLSRTHGQPATPTTLGKELAVLRLAPDPPAGPHRKDRILRQNQRCHRYLRGALRLGARRRLAAGVQVLRRAPGGLTFNPLTTQIESHDWQAEVYADIARFNRILHNLCTDMWSYISIGYFTQIPVEGATGSSTMPHKVNPIRFENAEANLEISNGLLDTLGATLVPAVGSAT